VQRVTFGSDYPHPRSALQQASEHLRALQVSESDRQAIASGNARRFYKV
jgi:predicted TIM-barrel fold metal-dependent hydrolase